MKRNFLLTSTFFVTNLVYLFAIASWVTIQSFSHLIDRWSNNSEMTIYLRNDVKLSDIQNLENFFKTYSELATSSFQSSESIRQSLQKLMPKSKLDFGNDEELVTAIPPHFIIKGASNLFGNSLFEVFEKISSEISKNPMVESTSFGKSWAAKYNSIIRSLQKATIVFLISIALALILVIGNTIRSHITAKREEIEILELVGATTTMIRRPYLIEGTLLSLVSMILALSTASFFVYLFKYSNGEFFRMLDLKSILWQISYFEWILAISLSGIIGFLGSYLCLTEINTGR